MYLFYFFIILSLLQLVMFRMPGLLLILVIAYAIYSLVQSFRLRQSTAGAQGNARSSSSSATAAHLLPDAGQTTMSSMWNTPSMSFKAVR